MSYIYEVVHCYDDFVDCGERKIQIDSIGVFSTREAAGDFVEKYATPNGTYDNFGHIGECGRLHVRQRQLDVPIKESDMWWLA